MNMNHLGWKTCFENSFELHRSNGLIPGRVSRRDRSKWTVCYQHGEIAADVTGSFRREAIDGSDWPAVGDWVAMSNESFEQATIHAVLQRLSCMSRKEAGERTDEQVLAANVDTAFLMLALDHDYNVRRLERYLMTAYESGIKPVVLLNKSDLHEEVNQFITEVETVAAGVEILSVSASENRGIDQLEKFIGEGQTVVLLGSSGVGKSTLINRLAGEELVKTGAIRQHDQRGRHTTTWRELIMLPSGGVVIDTPGMRELQMWASEESLNQMFDEIGSLAANCWFSDCQHSGEPGCAIDAALVSGEITTERLESYRKLGREVKRLETRKSAHGRHEMKKRGKKFASMIKQAKKLKIRRR